MLIEDNGNIRDNLNFKELCPMAQKESHARILYHPLVQRPFHEETEKSFESYWPISALAGEESMILQHWEFLKLLFTEYNISPIWIPPTNLEYFQCMNCLVQMVRFRICAT